MDQQYPYETKKDMLRRTLLGSAGAMLYSLLVLVSFSFEYFLIDGQVLILILALFWSGHLSLLYWFYSGKSTRFNDPSLTLPHMIWAILFVSIMLYHAVELRSALVLAYLSILPFGAFRLRWQGFLGVTLFTLACYIIALFALQQSRPGRWIVEIEVLIGVAFIIAMMGYSVLGREFSHLREKLADKNQQLQLALNKIEELAVTDELTGLYNRRYLMRMLEQQRAMSNREGSPFVIAFIDLDNFKQVNDQHGHLIGDQVLKQFSILLQESVREVDLVARFGGEEFVLLLNGVELATARLVVERIRSLVERMRFSEHQLQTTTSIGITQYRDTESIEQLIQRADHLLYVAKDNGRNRVESVAEQA